MKKLILLLLIPMIVNYAAYSQKYTSSFTANDAANKVSVMIEQGEIEIIGHNSNEIIVEAKGYKPPPEKAEGLKPLYAKGQDNSGIGLSIKNERNQLQIMGVRVNQSTDYIIRVPDQSSVNITIGPRNDNLLINDMKGEIELKAHSDDVVIKGIQGPVVANSISGDMKLVFEALTTEKPSVISLVSGDIDLTLPQETAANLKLSSVSGEVYTDFDVQMPGEQDENYGYRKPIEGKINGGGSFLELRTVSGNIYLRKK